MNMCLHCGTKLLNGKFKFCRDKPECEDARQARRREKKRLCAQKHYHASHVVLHPQTRVVVKTQYYTSEALPLTQYKYNKDGFHTPAYKRWVYAQQEAIYLRLPYCSLQNFHRHDKAYDPKKDHLLQAALKDPVVMANREPFPPYRGILPSNWNELMRKFDEQRGIT